MRTRLVLLAGLALAAACHGGDHATRAGSAAADAPHDAAPVVEHVASDGAPVERASVQPMQDTVASSADSLPAASPATAEHVPLVEGLTFVSALRFPDGDRESTVRVDQVTDAGARYAWQFRQQTRAGDTVDMIARRFVRANDLAAAPRLNGVFRAKQQEETPGYTAFSLSRAAYNRVRAERSIPFAITSLDGGALANTLGGALPVDLTTSRVTLRGTLTMTTAAPEPMPMLLNGQRVTLPAIHLAGRFAMQELHENTNYWVLADSANPLILRMVTGEQVEQVVRIDFPDSMAMHTVEGMLESTCRAELPGVYFAFASARLEPASEPALARLAALLRQHADWTLDVEGHTDSIGDAAANRVLSTQRADAVRSALVTRFRIAPARLRSVGYAASRPRETNATLEGRARNRRVELSRHCDANN
ncbi:MAG TPA: OmpA family protein [Gemmatimonadaceae bacterium]|nr:OmpA family protein [Gemmatimonadaceae bacterium]